MDDMEVVSALYIALADEVGKKRFKLWFDEKARLEFNGDTLTVDTPSRFFQDWLRSTFRRQIEKACIAVLGECPKIRFQVNANMESGTAALVQSDKATPSDSETTKNASHGQKQCESPMLLGSDSKGRTKKAATVVRAMGPPSPTPLCRTQGSPRKRFASFETFILGNSNRLARTSAEMVTQNLGQYSPLLIYGPTSVGKTHLLQSIWTAARRKYRNVATVYLSAEQFTTQYIEALRGSGLPSFRRKYRAVDLLIVDDLHFFLGKRSTLVELLYTIDTLLRHGRQVVFAADRPPSQLRELGTELVTRLESGMICDIKPPEHATRLGIVDEMARRLRLKVPLEVQKFVASRLTNHARELSGALCRLQAASQALNRPINRAMAEEALAEMIQHSGKVVRLGDIEKAICSAFGVESEALKSNRKSKSVSQPRMLAMWLARKHTRAALSEIGQFFGRRSHSTVISAQKRVDSWISSGGRIELPESDCLVDEVIRQVERLLLAS